MLLDLDPFFRDEPTKSLGDAYKQMTDSGLPARVALVTGAKAISAPRTNPRFLALFLRRYSPALT